MALVWPRIFKEFKNTNTSSSGSSHSDSSSSSSNLALLLSTQSALLLWNNYLKFLTLSIHLAEKNGTFTYFYLLFISLSFGSPTDSIHLAITLLAALNSEEFLEELVNILFSPASDSNYLSAILEVIDIYSIFLFTLIVFIESFPSINISYCRYCAFFLWSLFRYCLKYFKSRKIRSGSSTIRKSSNERKKCFPWYVISFLNRPILLLTTTADGNLLLQISSFIQDNILGMFSSIIVQLSVQYYDETSVVRR